MKYCPNCGAAIGDNTVFCSSCGAQVAPNKAPVLTDPVYAPAPNPVPAPSVSPKGDTSIGDWMLTMLLCGIPIVNFICLIVWAVSSSPEKRSRKNWAIAGFIWTAIIIAITVALWFALGLSLSAIMENLNY